MANNSDSSNLIAEYPAALAQQAMPNRRVPAWLMSFLVHTLLFVIVLLALRTVQRGASEIENRTGGIVLVDVQSDTTEYLDEGDVAESSSQPANEQSPPPLAASSELPPDLPGMEAAPTPITGAGDQLVDSLPGADSLMDGPPGSLKLGGKVTTEVFGVTGTGSRFVYVFDRSQSMMGYQARPLLAAKQALLKSLDSLGSNHQFQIVFYNDEVKYLNHDSMGTMYFANDDNKKEARDFIDSIQGDRGTDHMKALKLACRFGPDVIFLLTDAEGGFTPAELQDLSRFNRSGAVINAIEFGEFRTTDRSLEQLARESGGQYIFKNVRSLRIDNK